MKVIVNIMLIILISCTAKEEDSSTIEAFDPKLPGGTTSARAKTHDVLNLQVSMQTHEQTTLTWFNPPLYDGLSYEVYVYRIIGDASEGNFQLPDPSNPSGGAFLYYPRLDFQASIISNYLDHNNDNGVALRAGDTYTYLVYVKKGDTFSSGKKITITVPTQDSLVTIPNPSDFWKEYISKQGSPPDSISGDILHETIYVDNLDHTASGGEIAFTRNGLVAARTDTANNRIILYLNEMGMSCYDSLSEGTVEFNNCILLNSNAPLQAYAVLGQVDFTTKFACGDAGNTLDNNECMTRPKGVIFHEEKLFFTDEEGRVGIFDDLPRYGCFNIKNFLGDSTPKNCRFDRVIGKMNTEDLTTYSLAADGDASLSCPNGMAFLGDNLYIADTCNHRIIRVENANNPTLVNCTNSSWKTSKCLFSSVLGQPDMFSNENFADEFDIMNFTYDYISDTLVGDLEFLKRHFSYPTRLAFTDSNKLVVVANENFSRLGPWGDLQLYSRVLFFDETILEGTLPVCTHLTFLANGCDATDVLGQKDWHQLSVIPSGMSYSDNNYALKRTTGIEIYSNYLFLADYESNEIIIYNDYKNLTHSTIPFMRVQNPLGAWESSQNRSLPNLKGLTDIYFDENTGNLTILDSKGSYFYKIPIISF